MNSRQIILLLLILICAQAKASLITTARNGFWSDSLTWDSGAPPQDGDSIILLHSVVCQDSVLELGPGTFMRIDSGAMLCIQGLLILRSGTLTRVHDMLRVGRMWLEGDLYSDGIIWARELITVINGGYACYTGYECVGINFDCDRFYYPEGMNPHIPREEVEPIPIVTANRLWIYPDPATDQLNLHLQNPLNTRSKAELIDAAGRLIYTEEMEAGQTDTMWMLGNLQAGAYLVRVTDSKHRMQKKLILLH